MMPTIIPADYADLLDDATPATLILTTLRRDGLPVLAPVWFVTEGDGLLIAMDLNSLKARLRLRRVLGRSILTSHLLVPLEPEPCNARDAAWLEALP